MNDSAPYPPSQPSSQSSQESGQEPGQGASQEPVQASDQGASRESSQEAQGSPQGSDPDRPGRSSGPARTRGAEGRRDRDDEGKARNARPRDGLGRPLPYGTPGVERQPEGVVRGPVETVTEAQELLDAGRPFHAHEVFEDAWKTGPEEERALWRGLAQLAVGLTHAARGNRTGGARLLRRGAAAIDGAGSRHGIDVPGLVMWASELADRVERDPELIDAAASAPVLAGGPSGG